MGSVRHVLLRLVTATGFVPAAPAFRPIPTNHCRPVGWAASSTSNSLSATPGN